MYEFQQLSGLPPLAEKGRLVIFPSIQDSQVGNETIADAWSGPSLTGFLKLSRLI